MTKIRLRNAERGLQQAEERNRQLQKEMEDFFQTFGWYVWNASHVIFHCGGHWKLENLVHSVYIYPPRLLKKERLLLSQLKQIHKHRRSQEAMPPNFWRT